MSHAGDEGARPRSVAPFASSTRPRVAPGPGIRAATKSATSSRRAFQLQRQAWCQAGHRRCPLDPNRAQPGCVGISRTPAVSRASSSLRGPSMIAARAHNCRRVGRCRSLRPSPGAGAQNLYASSHSRSFVSGLLKCTAGIVVVPGSTRVTCTVQYDCTVRRPVSTLC